MDFDTRYSRNSAAELLSIPQADISTLDHITFNHDDLKGKYYALAEGIDFRVWCIVRKPGLNMNRRVNEMFHKREFVGDVIIVAQTNTNGTSVDFPRKLFAVFYADLTKEKVAKDKNDVQKSKKTIICILIPASMFEPVKEIEIEPIQTEFRKALKTEIISQTNIPCFAKTRRIISVRHKSSSLASNSRAEFYSCFTQRNDVIVTALNGNREPIDLDMKTFTEDYEKLSKEYPDAPSLEPLAKIKKLEEIESDEDGSNSMMIIEKSSMTTRQLSEIINRLFCKEGFNRIWEYYHRCNKLGRFYDFLSSLVEDDLKNFKRVNTEDGKISTPTDIMSMCYTLARVANADSIVCWIEKNTLQLPNPKNLKSQLMGITKDYFEECFESSKGVGYDFEVLLEDAYPRYLETLKWLSTINSNEDFPDDAMLTRHFFMHFSIFRSLREKDMINITVETEETNFKYNNRLLVEILGEKAIE